MARRRWEFGLIWRRFPNDPKKVREIGTENPFFQHLGEAGVRLRR
jgi:hypothetical protein